MLGNLCVEERSERRRNRPQCDELAIFKCSHESHTFDWKALLLNIIIIKYYILCQTKRAVKHVQLCEIVERKLYQEKTFKKYKLDVNKVPEGLFGEPKVWSWETLNPRPRWLIKIKHNFNKWFNSWKWIFREILLHTKFSRVSLHRRIFISFTFVHYQLQYIPKVPNMRTLKDVKEIP